MPDIEGLLEAQGLGRLTPWLKSAAKDSVLLSAVEPGENAVTRLGGRPNLPAGIAWPEWNGQPLSLVAQLDLASIPPLTSCALPREGALFFFYEGGQQTWGFSPDDRGSAQVIFSPDPLDRHPLRDYPEGLSDDFRFRGVHLSAGEPQPSLPDYSDPALDTSDLRLEEREAYFNFITEWLGQTRGMQHRVGGYPEPIQDDPKLEAQLVTNGIDCGSPAGYEEGKRRGLWPGAIEWELLLQVDSEEQADMMWGDAGRLYYLIRKSDLEASQFDRAWMVLQCS
jgi:uncharacterized protein YwqG